MNFKKATDALFNKISHEELAGALGVSVASIRQARLDSNAKAHRAPPPDWHDAVLRLATKQANQYRQLIEVLRDKKRGKTR